MKKYILFLLITGTIVSCDDKLELKTVPIMNLNLKDSIVFVSKKNEELSHYQYTPTQIQFLKEMNLTHSTTYMNNLNLVDQKIRDKYFKKFHVEYLSVDFINKFLVDKGLVLGDLVDYKGTIPPNNIDEFKMNYNNCIAVDSSLKSIYFIRINQHSREHPGNFLQIINSSEIEPNTLNNIIGGFGFVAHDQRLNHDGVLYNDRYTFYEKKYKLNQVDIIVDNHVPEIKIIAPKESFNLDNKVIENNKISSKDPAIVLHIGEGWLVLTTWK